jgi:hypothetical protein
MHFFKAKKLKIGAVNYLEFNNASKFEKKIEDCHLKKK